MSNFLVQDIFKDRKSLEFPHADYSEHLKAFKNCFAPPIHDDKLRETTLFQIVDIQDTSKSVLSEIEELKRLVDINESFYDYQKFGNADNKKKKKRTTIDVNLEEDENEIDDNFMNDKNYIPKRVFRLILEDCFGNICYAYEQEPLNFLRNNNQLYPIKLGYKILVYKDAKIIFNTLQLRNLDIKPLGGEIDKLNYKLHERKLRELKLKLSYDG